ncbi:MAG: glucose-6-phosphate 1-dehydrogenase [Patescibacteria group bacterium]|nr:glucose-6-phosphate 1-dehydrogenase [Patescibacteria group bacterium]
MTSLPPTVLVIIGITGDLSIRKLLPAIEQIASLGAAPEQLHVIGLTRRNVSPNDVLQKVSTQTTFLQQALEMFQMDFSSSDDFLLLKQRLTQLKNELGSSTQVLFYLSIPPQISHSIITLLGDHGIAQLPNTKLLLEKPFGVDLESAEELVEHIKNHFTEDQVYRIDHYLAKEMTQNLVVFRQGNSLIKQTWNKDFIESIEVLASESLGIEGRAEFYEQTGALRDLIQSHLLELAALVLADIPSSDLSDIPAQRLAALQQLKTPQDIDAAVVRAQYEGYRDEVSNPVSLVETFVSVRLFSSDPRWEGVPITLTTGKSLATKTTEIRIKYKQKHADEANTLILHIQPDEGVEFDIWAKRPGYERELQKLPLSFQYQTHFDELPEAYEKVFLDAMKSDHTLFTRSDEVLETWRILDPIQKHWEMSADIPIYPKKSLPENI